MIFSCSSGAYKRYNLHKKELEQSSNSSSLRENRQLTLTLRSLHCAQQYLELESECVRFACLVQFLGHCCC